MIFKSTNDIQIYKCAGFSLLEVMIAVLIITMGMIGVLSLVLQNIQVQYINKNDLIASQLAQEGLELVRNIRDENWLDGNAYDSGIVGDGTYTIDYTFAINDLINSIDDVGAKLNINGAGFYIHGAGSATPFYRLITVDDSSAEHLKVECKVRWSERSRTHDYTAATLLYDWR
ncbi:prepilin-type N-terminal cleavage/methylation domain-containing protein [Patescibacteria group bacterium]|nr:prepilin-type N-terminal cleavage/methylation domain-containing protein [Candidatus Falkowbacteria bacterium]MBU3906128.1 prepilin-type N-terminal cleavage/methylation domain-containing protein [Patescibacteria group bacterium]MCG2697688.1 prepilin-type N-terminal cleavage/methylation domain-containing protein [Candidatus Parcubacteria bacterium]MBU4014945.1 prepilin-type N-terminal cleavage/methylation domain-containing protein [Patescibacteria group bacterium]MBU4026076.1 prepilin-type N-t